MTTTCVIPHILSNKSLKVYLNPHDGKLRLPAIGVLKRRLVLRVPLQLSAGEISGKVRHRSWPFMSKHASVSFLFRTLFAIPCQIFICSNK